MKNICPSISIKNYTTSLCGILLYVVMFSLLCALGFWQLSRAEEKRLFLANQQTQSEENINLNQFDSPNLANLEYKNVIVRGDYDSSKQILINNQIKDGKVGYFVMTPLFIRGMNASVLVNRGWVPMDRTSQTLPDISLQQTSVEISGRVNHFPSVGMALDGADELSERWPSEVQIINPAKVIEKLGYSIVDFQIELNPEHAGGYQRNWQELRIIPPEKHIAYAVQWFALAVTLSAMFIWYTIKQK